MLSHWVQTRDLHQNTKKMLDKEESEKRINNTGNASAFFKPDLPNCGAIVNRNNLHVSMMSNCVLGVTCATYSPFDYESATLLWNVVKTLPLLQWAKAFNPNSPFRKKGCPTSPGSDSLLSLTFKMNIMIMMFGRRKVSSKSPERENK